jgi:hypothetical protein
MVAGSYYTNVAYRQLNLVLTASLSQILCLQVVNTDTILQKLSSMTWLTRLHISAPNYQAASGSLQCVNALRRLRDLKIVDMQPLGSITGLAIAPPLSYCTALTRLGDLHVPTEVHTRSVC